MRLRLRGRLGPRAASRPRILPDPSLPRGAAFWWGGMLRIGGAEPERAGAAAVLALPAGTRRAVLDARALAPDAAVAMAGGMALRAPRGFRLDLWHDDPEALAPLWQRARAVLRGVALARRLVASPGNVLTPRRFAHRLKRLERHGIAVHVLGPKRLRQAGFGALLAVGQGSANPPRLAVLRWAGRIPVAPLVLVGKGITFDTGGLSLKRGPGMEVMAGDMAGAAACAGAMLAAALRNSPAPLAAVLPLAENSPGAAACRPGDVITTLSGQTVEVVDTDAEGRLVLADALNYAVRAFRPEAVVDLATLTGAAIAALGHERAAIFTNDPPLAAALCAAGEAVGERLWPLPVTEADDEALRSDIADLRQCCPSGPQGRHVPDASHAAAFLHRFLGPHPPAWAHLDIAGTIGEEVRWRPEGDAASPDTPLTVPGGFGVRLLDALVANRFEDPHRI
ncbi:leucyl aminopeptidase family protein [Teichococcus oryzae]|uniref:Leucyl aminopeptidase family protein n=1 Tax=Teichococcus oryzae TaxID=1608942 RepID=A0A5B2TI88_9PROT|nr:leucyl aminopeptidase family protein [Pseudoroseomonas oryzae]KAA2214196.1 leucyl aminopeptidase family protein [Pseudoroseomonas oryzae]